ncbi:hypothetical protein OG787_05305 [Streptomyces sp. NBC_00075]|uniref:hypothetical protein n=1 Tax=Streptomyces sp. NBC_00075 TaxID=2975641 RepID=UPI0032441856
MPIELTLTPGFPRYARALLTTAAQLFHPADGTGPVGGVRAGAVLQDGSGRAFTAASPAYPGGPCAEAAVLASARSAGDPDPRVLAVVSAAAHGTGIALPCGGCRQLLCDAAYANGRDIEIYCADTSLSAVVLVTATELLPLSPGIPVAPGLPGATG